MVPGLLKRLEVKVQEWRSRGAATKNRSPATAPPVFLSSLHTNTGNAPKLLDDYSPSCDFLVKICDITVAEMESSSLLSTR